jgi:hypothetical protein
MRSDTQTITISATPRRVVEFLADPRNLPRWAVGFAKGVREDEGRWLVTTGAGEMGLRIEADVASGVVDFVLSPAPGVEVLAASRVVPNGAGSEYVFTQFEAPATKDGEFEKSKAAVAHELTVLRALLEVECPL